MFSAAVAAACQLRAERMQTVCRGDTVIEIDAGEGTYSDDFWTQNCDGRTLAEVAGQWQASYGAALTPSNLCACDAQSPDRRLPAAPDARLPDKGDPDFFVDDIVEVK